MILYIKEQSKINELMDMYYWLIGEARFIDILKHYSSCEGYGSEYAWCCFANQIYEWEEDYLGDNGVVYHFEHPVADEDCSIKFSNEEFYNQLSIRCDNHIKKFPEQGEDVLMYLEKTKLSLGI